MKRIWTEKREIGKTTKREYQSRYKDVYNAEMTYSAMVEAFWDRGTSTLVLDMKVNSREGYYDTDYGPGDVDNVRIFETHTTREAAIRSVIQWFDNYCTTRTGLIPPPDERSDEEAKAEWLHRQGD